MGFKACKQAIKNLPENKKEIAEGLIKEAEFMASELKKLRKEIKEHGWTEIYQHGEKQSGVKPSSAASQYNALIKNYNITMKAILELVPDKTAEADALEAEFFK